MMAVLNPKPGSSTAKQRQMLHRIKRRRGWSDAELHNAIGTDSTTKLSARKASEHIQRLTGMDLPNEPGQRPSPYAGKKSVGAIRMIDNDHVEQIYRLGLLYFARPAAFGAWLSKNFNVPFRQLTHMDDIPALLRQLGTAERAGHVIYALREMLTRREDKLKADS